MSSVKIEPTTPLKSPPAKRKKTTSSNFSEEEKSDKVDNDPDFVVEETPTKKAKKPAKKRARQSDVSSKSKDTNQKSKRAKVAKKDQEDSDDADEDDGQLSTTSSTNLPAESTVKNPEENVEVVDDRTFYSLVLDEIALEGLDGITIEALWTRINLATNYTAVLTEQIKEDVWNYVKAIDAIEFFELQTPRPKLVVLKRNDRGSYDENLEDIYPFEAIDDKENGIVGSCSTYKTRRNITTQVRCMGLEETENKYGRKLVLVASQQLRRDTLLGESTNPSIVLNEQEYFILERIGRSRKDGLSVTGPQSLQVILKDPKSSFYYRKNLLKNQIISKQNLTGEAFGRIFHLRRYYNEVRTERHIAMEQIIQALKEQPNCSMELSEVKQRFGKSIRTTGYKFYNFVDFKQYVKSVVIPYRQRYPNATPKEWQNKFQEEKQIRMLQLIDPNVNLATLWKETEPKEESSDDEVEGEAFVDKPLINQIYSILYNCGKEGITQKGIIRKCGADYYSVRGALKSLEKMGLINSELIDFGKLRFTRYSATCFNNPEVYEKFLKEKESQKPAFKRQEVDNETLDFISGVLGVESVYLKPPEENDELVSENDFIDNSDDRYLIDVNDEILGKERYIAANRRKHKIAKYNCEKTDPEEYKRLCQIKPEYEDVFKNAHGYVSHSSCVENNLIENNVGKIDLGLIKIPTGSFKRQVTRPRYLDEDDDDNEHFRTTSTAEVERLLEVCKSSCYIPVRQLPPKVFKGNLDNCRTIFQQMIGEHVKIDYVDLIMRANELLDELKVMIKKDEYFSFRWPQSDIEDFSDEEDVLSVVVNLEGEGVLNRTRQKQQDYVNEMVASFENEKLTEKLLESKPEELPSLELDAKIEVEDVEMSSIGIIEEDVQQLANETVKEEEDAAQGASLGIFMGSNPQLLESIEQGGYEIKVYISTPFLYDEPLPIKDKSSTEKNHSRLVAILNELKKESGGVEIFNLPRVISDLEGTNKPDRKTMNRLFAKLVQTGHARMIQVILSRIKVIKTKTLIFTPDADIEKISKNVLEEMKHKFCLPWEPVMDIPNEEPLAKIEIPYKAERLIGRQYGYTAKFAKTQILHEFMVYLAYDFSKSTPIEGKNVIQHLTNQKISVDESCQSMLSTIYSPTVDWRMFIPPLQPTPENNPGWILYANILSRMPLSIFVKIYSVPYLIPELFTYLSHPVLKNVLVFNLPAVMRAALLSDRKYIFNIHEIMQLLCYMGLLQFGPQTMKEKDQMYFYVNKHAIFYDTTTSSPSYHLIENKPYEKLTFTINSLSNASKYWHKLWHICVNSKLGMREEYIGKYIITEHLHTKPQMIESCKATTLEKAVEKDVGYLPGDGLGAAKTDSSLWIFMKKSWLRVGKKANFLERVVTKKNLKEKTSKKEKVMCKQNKKRRISAQKIHKHKPLFRKILPRSKKIRSIDEVDSSIRKKMGNNRAVFTEVELKLLSVLRMVAQYLCPYYRKRSVGSLVIRDVMHATLPHLPKKTSKAHNRRIKILNNEDKKGNNKALRFYSIYRDEYVQKYFKPIRDGIRKGETISDVKLHNAFIYLVAHVRKKIAEEDQTTHKTESTQIDFLTKEAIKICEQVDKDVKDMKKMTQADVENDLIKVSIHSALLNKNKLECNYKLFLLYNRFSDAKLRAAALEMRDAQIVSASKASGLRENIKGMNVGGLSYQMSAVYSFRQVTHYPFCSFADAYKYFQGVLKYKDYRKTNGLCIDYLEQGHGLALLELFSAFRIEFSVSSPVDMLRLDESLVDYNLLVPELAIRYRYFMRKKDNTDDKTPFEFIPEMFDNLDNLEETIEKILRDSMLKEKYTKFSTFDRKQINDDKLTLVTVNPDENIQKENASELGEVEIIGDTMIFPINLSSGENAELSEMPKIIVPNINNKIEPPSVAQLSLLLNKGTIPELDKDAEKIKKLNRMFNLVEPSLKIHVFDEIEETELGQELLNYPAKVEEILAKTKSKLFLRPSYPQLDEIRETFAKTRLSLIDVDQIISVICDAGPVGIPASNLINVFPNIDNVNLIAILNKLFKLNVLLKVGSFEVVVVHYDFRDYYCMGLDNNDSEQTGYIQMMPWIRLDGEYNMIGFEAWMHSVLSFCMNNAFAPLNTIFKRFNLHRPYDIYFLLEILEEMGCIRMKKSKVEECDLLSSVSEFDEETYATFLDRFEDIYVEVDQLATIKMGCFISRNDELETPFDEQFDSKTDDN